MKILLIVNTDGALYIFRKPIIKYLISSGFLVESISGKSKFFGLLSAMGVKVHDLDFARHSVSFSQNAQLLFRLKNYIEKISPDIVHNFTHKPSIYGSIAAKLAGVQRIFVTITGLGTLFTNDDLKNRVLRELLILQYRIALRFVQTVFFQNPDDLEYFVRRRVVCPKKAILTNGSGIDLIEYPPPSDEEVVGARAMLSAEIGQDLGRRLVVLFPARGVRDKGFFEYYESAKMLNEREPSRFLFLHLGWVDDVVQGHISREDIKAFAGKYGVQYLGFKDNIRDYMIAADIVTLPSYREGVPRSLIEALALGRTIVTTNVPGCRETVIDGWNGYLVPPRNADELAERINQINDEFIELSKTRSRDLCEKKFDAKLVVELTTAKYFENTNL